MCAWAFSWEGLKNNLLRKKTRKNARFLRLGDHSESYFGLKDLEEVCPDGFEGHLWAPNSVSMGSSSCHQMFIDRCPVSEIPPLVLHSFGFIFYSSTKLQAVIIPNMSAGAIVCVFSALDFFQESWKIQLGPNAKCRCYINHFFSWQEDYGGNSTPGCISKNNLHMWPKDMDRNNYSSPMHNNTNLETTKVPVDKEMGITGREITVKMIEPCFNNILLNNRPC